MLDLTIPEPHAVVPASFGDLIRQQTQEIDDLEILENGRRRLAALEKYVRDKKQQIEVQASSRWCEVRIGELLPPPEDEVGGRGNKASFTSEGLDHRQERYLFRRLASYLEIVEKCIKQSIVSRSAILAQIDRYLTKKAGENIDLSESYRIEQADIRTWITSRQYDWIITDPPYPREYLNLYSVLAERAAVWLKPGSLLVAMCGQSYLDEIYSLLNEHLQYYWTAAYLLPGQPTPLRQVNVNCSWKPLLMFSRKGDKYTGKIFGDVFRSDESDKDFHEWGQSISGMSNVVSRLCLPGEYILDPFCGAGTTGVAAIRHGCLFDGIDIDPDHCAIARARIHNDATTI